jgi:hypothetical protein
MDKGNISSDELMQQHAQVQYYEWVYLSGLGRKYFDIISRINDNINR